MKFAYYPGCSAIGTSADYEVSTRIVCKDLNFALNDLQDWNCCGSTPAHAVSSELSAALCVRNLDLAAKTKAEKLLTPCPSCLSNLRHAAHRMEDAEFRASVDSLLDEPSAPSFPEALSVMQALVDTYGIDILERRAAKKFNGIRLAPYYGCLMSRPAEIMNFGNAENPQMMEDILRACGAEIIDFPLKTSCCGASFGIPERPMTAKLSGKILELAHNMKADAIIVACPLCQMNLDLRQDQASKAMQMEFDIPVLYFTQIIGLAFGHKPEKLGLEKLCVSPKALLNKFDQAAHEALKNASSKRAKGATL